MQSSRGSLAMRSDIAPITDGSVTVTRIVLTPPPRLNAACTTLTSAQTSDSLTSPFASKIPTIFSLRLPDASSEPRSIPANWPLAERPTIASLVPN